MIDVVSQKLIIGSFLYLTANVVQGRRLIIIEAQPWYGSSLNNQVKPLTCLLNSIHRPGKMTQHSTCCAIMSI